MDESVMKSVQCHSAEEKDDQNEVWKSGGEIYNLKKMSYLLIYIDYRICTPFNLMILTTWGQLFKASLA